MISQHVVISGSSGLIGTALRESLSQDGIRVSRLVRGEARDATEISWQPGIRPLDPAHLEGVTALVNLAGTSIARVPWTRGYREELVTSRLQTTRTLVDAIRQHGDPSLHLLSASAVGYYGDRPGKTLDETADPGDTFLARLCLHWEKSALRATGSAKVSLLRTAPVLHPDGVLKPLIPLTRLGLAGPLGGGRQHWPWISLHDEVRAIRHIIERELDGPVNLTGPQPVTATDIGRALADQLHRPYLLPAPRWALRTVLGRDAADGLLLSDARVQPARLIESGFEFTHPTVREAITAGLEN